MKRDASLLIAITVLTTLLIVFFAPFSFPAIGNANWHATDVYPDHTLTGVWTSKAPMSVPRDRPAAVVLDGKIYVMGGTNSSGALASMEVYDPATNTWTRKANMPGPKTDPGAAVVNGRIYVVGLPDNRLYEYNPAADRWTEKAPLPVTPAGSVAVASISGKIFVAFAVSGESRWRLYAYDPFQDRWERRSDHPDQRSIASFGISNGMIYAVGGGIAGQIPQETARIDQYDPMNDQWTLNAIPPMRTRRTHLGATLPTIYGRMFVFGGWDGYTTLADAEVYDPWTNQWSTLPSMPTARYKAAYAAVGYKIYVIGGNRGGAGGNWMATNEEFALPEPTQPENPIAFVSDKDGYYEIYTMNPDGSRRLRITNDGCANWHPSWTYDGKRILFSTDCGGKRDIYSMNPDGSDWRRLTNTPGVNVAIATRPFMSPDGRKIAFLYGLPPEMHIWLMNPDGTNQHQLTTGPGTEDDTHIAWSPDSRSIVFRSTRSGSWQLWRINVDGTGLTQLTNLSGEAHDPAWSPDGSTIAFASQGEIMLMKPDGSGIQVLAGPGWEFRPDWSPDGGRLVYGSYRHNTSDIFSKRSDNTDERNLTNTPGSNDWDPAWAKPRNVCVGGATPVDVMLVIDRSGSMSGRPLADAKAAAKGFVDRMNMVQDQVGLVSFADSATLNRQLTRDANAVKAAIDALTAGGSTNITAGINTAQAELQSSRRNPAARPIMVFLSDGVPTVDTPSSAIAAAQAAKNAGTRIFAIGLGSVDENLMRQIASSPADYYYAPTSEDLASIYQSIAGQVICTRPLIKVSPVNKRVSMSGNFTMDIVAEDVTNLAAYEVELRYNPSIIHVTAVTPGPFLGSTGRTVNPVGPIIDNSAGVVRFGAFTIGTQPGVNGTGILATITFQPRNRGISTLRLQNLQATDPSGNLLSVATEDGQVEIIGCLGDFDGDGDVDIQDLQRAASRWNCRSGDVCYDVQFDTEPDGDVDIFDLQRFAAVWGTTCSRQASYEITAEQTLQTSVGLQLWPPNGLIARGETFTLTLRIQNANNVGAFQTDIVYDPVVVEAEAVVVGPFLGSTGRTVNPLGPIIDNVNGRVTFGAYTYGNQPGASGSGDLAYVRLKGKSVGQTLVELQRSGVSNPEGEPLYLGNLENSTLMVGSQVFRIYLPVVLRNR